MILLAIILRSIVGILSYPATMLLFWAVMSIVYFQYTRLSAMERQWTTRSSSPLARTMRSLGEGLVGDRGKPLVRAPWAVHRPHGAGLSVGGCSGARNTGRASDLLFVCRRACVYLQSAVWLAQAGCGLRHRYGGGAPFCRGRSDLDNAASSQRPSPY